MDLNKVVFLDRDGTINRDSPDYVKNWEQFEFLPGSLEALVQLTRCGYTLIVITNQSAVGRGLISLATLERTHRLLRQAVAAAGGRIADILFCPHRPEDLCECRKPRPGLIRQACRRHGLDPAHCVMVGDSARDILCAKNAGCGRAILVRTGNAADAEKALAEQKVPPDASADDLRQAVDLILSFSRQQEGI